MTSKSAANPGRLAVGDSPACLHPGCVFTGVFVTDQRTTGGDAAHAGGTRYEL